MTRQTLPRLLLALALILTAVTACAPSETQVLVALFDEWAREKGFNPRDEEGKVDVMGVLGVAKTVASAALTGSTGDEEADAAVGILGVVFPIKGYDEQTDKGLDTRDPTQIQNAIDGRPNDFHYRNAYGVVMLANGKENSAEAAFDAAEDTWKKTNPTWSERSGDLANSRDIMGNIDRAIRAEKSNSTPPEGQEALRKRYCSEARWYADSTGSPYYLARAIKELQFDCSDY